MVKQLLPAALLVVTLPGGALAGQTPPTVDFKSDVLPLLKQHCIGCHGPDQQMSAFRLDRRSAAIRGGRDANDIVPGSSATSHLYVRLVGGGKFPQMPPTGRLNNDAVATFKAWLDQGAGWPDEVANETILTPPDPRADRLMAALRNGEAATVGKRIAREPDVVNLRGLGGATPLMYAALYGDPQAVRRLLDAGANPNIKNYSGATALMWAVGDLEKTRLLIDRGADVNARSDDGRTPLDIAAGQRVPTAVAKLLLDRGAKPGAGGGTPLELSTFALAARMGNADVMALLLDRGVKEPGGGPVYWAVSNKCDRCLELALKTVSKAGLDTALSLLVRKDDPAAVRMLLERGANPNVTDARGNTALMGAAASEFVRAEIVDTLLGHGAEVNAVNRDGMTALTFARQRGLTPVVEALVKAGAIPGTPAPAAYGSSMPTPVPAHSAREAVQRSLPLLQKTDVVFLQNTGCVSCHHNSLTAMAVAAARRNGFTVNDPVAAQQLKMIHARQADWRDRALQGMVLADTPFIVGYTLMGMAAENDAPDATTDAMAIFLLNNQLADGHWRLSAHRPPIEFSELTATATSVRALQLYAPKSYSAAASQAVRSARVWLTNAAARTSEERNMRVLGLAWSGADKRTLAAAVKATVTEQRADGGWAQLPWLDSDAYGTGQTLVALHEAGMPVRDPVYQRGIRYLLDHQMQDGSWWVKTRSVPTQVPFDSGFPHGADQWISAAATNWSTIAMAEAAKYERTPARTTTSGAGPQR